MASLIFHTAPRRGGKSPHIQCGFWLGKVMQLWSLAYRVGAPTRKPFPRDTWPLRRKRRRDLTFPKGQRKGFYTYSCLSGPRRAQWEEVVSTTWLHVLDASRNNGSWLADRAVGSARRPLLATHLARGSWLWEQRWLERVDAVHCWT